MTRTEETWQRLLNWVSSPETADFVAQEVLLDQGFTRLPNAHPAASGNADSAVLYGKDDQRWLLVIHFAPAQQSFEQVKSRFLERMAALGQYSANGLVFFTNQELSRNERIDLTLSCTFPALEVFDLDRIATLLDSPRLVPVRQQALYPETMPTSVPDSPAGFLDFSALDTGPGMALALEQAIRLAQSQAKPGTTHAQWLGDAPNLWRNRIAGHSNLIQLNKISLKNYRGFHQIEIAIEPDITVLVANNGQGKTSVLDACRLALWPFLSGFDLAHTGNDEPFTIKPDDANFQQIAANDWAHQFPVAIGIDGNYGPYSGTGWSQYLDDAKPDSAIRDDDGGAALKAYARLLQWQVRNPQLPPLDLPVFAYYDTDRSWSRQRPRIGPEQAKWAEAGNEFNIRTFAYRDCLKSAVSYDTFEQWFAWIFTSYRETQIKNREAGLPDDAPSDWQDAIYVVQQAINSLLRKHTGWHSLEFSLSQNALILRNDQHLTLKVTQLSDGIRNILGMVGDLAFRCIKVNPHLGKQAALAARGVVLIDEIDMHLHPGWQQHVVAQLREAFPLLQFIITTHSHQVLSSVFARSIRRLHQPLDAEPGDFAIEPVQYETRGVASSDILARIMKVDEVPDVPEAKKLSQYRAMIQSGLHESAAGADLAAQLAAHFGNQHPEMLECARLIQLEELKRKVAAARAAKATPAAGNGNA